MLAFLTGRLEARIDRALVAAIVLLVLILYLPTMFVVERHPMLRRGRTATTPAPRSSFMLSTSEPAVVVIASRSGTAQWCSSRTSVAALIDGLLHLFAGKDTGNTLVGFAGEGET